MIAGINKILDLRFSKILPPMSFRLLLYNQAEKIFTELTNFNSKKNLNFAKHQLPCKKDDHMKQGITRFLFHK